MLKEKGHETSSIASGSQPYAELYDPSKESVWTRVGVTWESFKRAPGTTGYGLPMISLGTRFQFWGFFVIVSGQIVAGSNNVEDVEKVMADAPMLQQKMKSRHLTMIAVGMDFFFV